MSWMKIDAALKTFISIEHFKTHEVSGHEANVSVMSNQRDHDRRLTKSHIPFHEVEEINLGVITFECSG